MAPVAHDDLVAHRQGDPNLYRGVAPVEGNDQTLISINVGARVCSSDVSTKQIK